MKFLLCLAVLLSSTASVTSQALLYTDKAVEAGIFHSYGAGSPGGGVSFYDFNQDGWDDLTMGTALGEPLHFYANEGGNFRKLDPLVGHNEEAKQVLWADYDNDNDPDLYVSTYRGPNRLYRNEGDLSLRDVTIESGLPLEFFLGYGACWSDVNRDGLLDLYFAERKGPGLADQNENRLFMQQPGGTFIEATISSGAQDLGKKPFCSAFFDIDQDKWPDLYTANDKLTGNTMLQNMGQGQFADVSEMSGTGFAMNAMCVALGDYNRDGFTDLYITNTEEGNLLLAHTANPSRPAFENLAVPLGVSFRGISWGANFFDADNDADLDLYVSGSSVGRSANSAALYLNDDGLSFRQSQQGFEGDTVLSYTNATGDFNNDGAVDIVVSNHEPFTSQLWTRSAGTASWLKIDLEGVLSNREGIGARIEVAAANGYQMHFTHSGIGFLGQNSQTVHFGFGDVSRVDSILITWPTGHVDQLFDVEVDQKIFIREGNSTDGRISVDRELNLVTSIRQDERKVLNISPNPVRDALRISYMDSSWNLRLLDVRGREVSIFYRSDLIDVKHLRPGLYFLICQKGRHGEVHQLIKI